MGRSDVSAVAHGAKPPCAAAYEHLVVEEQRREWERTKEDLGAAKKQIAEKDDLILQLKTQVRKLQETLQKKDKDLQVVFAVLRAPQDAELTKKRKQELVGRLVVENQQRAVNAEAIAEERKRELDRLKYSSKFLRYQELEVELEEYRNEIERLRAMPTAPTSPSRPLNGVVVGKLKVSAILSSTTGAEGDARCTKTNKTSVPNPHQGASIRISSVKAALRQDTPGLNESRGTMIAGKGKVLLTTAAAKPSSAHPVKKESFVIKTRRRAQEAEYYKQVRLAQLEAECELEENIHIRTAREVKAQLESEKKSRAQQREAAATREKIAVLQQLRAISEEETEQEQSNNVTVVVVEVLGDPNRANPDQDNVDKRLSSLSEVNGKVPSAGKSKSAPVEAVGSVPGAVEEQKGIPVSSQPDEPTAQPGDIDKAADAGDIKSSDDPDVSESFSEETKQQNQVPASQAKAEPDAIGATDEATRVVGKQEVEPSKEVNGSEDEDAEEQDVDAEVKIEEVSTKYSGSPGKQIGPYAAIEDPLEISDAEEEEEEMHSRSDTAGGAADVSLAAVTDKDRLLGDNAIEEQPAKAPVSKPSAIVPVSDHLYDDEDFDDDPKEQDYEPEQPVNEVDQHHQGLLLDVVDSHTKLGIPEVSEEDLPDSEVHEHRQGFLLDVVDPHSCDKPEKGFMKLLVRALQTGTRIEHLFAQLNANADGEVTATELRRALEELFRGQGHTKDGTVVIDSEADTGGDTRAISLHDLQTFAHEIERNQRTLASFLLPHAAKLADVAKQPSKLARVKWQELCTTDLKLTQSRLDVIASLLLYFELVDESERVDLSQLCALVKPPAVIPTVGDRVEVWHKDASKFYHRGLVSRCHLNGTYDVDCDDGEKETGVAPELIRSLAKSSMQLEDDESPRTLPETLSGTDQTVEASANATGSNGNGSGASANLAAGGGPSGLKQEADSVEPAMGSAGVAIQCVAQNPAGANQVEVEISDVRADVSVVERPVAVESSDDQPKAEAAGDDFIEKQIASGIESASYLGESIAEESASVVSGLHLTAAELGEAMHAAARKIQQFWRQMDARFRRALGGQSASSDVATVEASADTADAIASPVVDEERAREDVEEGEKEEEEQVAASGSGATSPSYTPYSTPRDTDSDDQHSQSQDSQGDGTE